MSDSSESDANLSDLEDEQAVAAAGSDADGADKVELKGILNDVEETPVTWKDLVSFYFQFISTAWSKIVFIYRD